MLTLTMAVFYSSVPLSHGSVTVSQHAQYQYPETEAAQWNSAISDFTYTFSYSDMEKGMLYSLHSSFLRLLQTKAIH